jgi:hypothetical protein
MARDTRMQPKALAAWSRRHESRHVMGAQPGPLSTVVAIDCKNANEPSDKMLKWLATGC